MFAGPICFNMGDVSKDWANGLPDDTMALIFKAVGIAKMKKMRRVCKGWQGSYELAVSSLRITSNSPALPPGAEALRRFAGLTHLDLGESSVIENWLQNLAGFQNLRVLVLGQETIPAWRHLTERLTDAGLAHLWGLPLTQLSLQASSLCSYLRRTQSKHLFSGFIQRSGRQLQSGVSWEIQGPFKE